eukprot:CAMPEP_0170079116 /NCGR_PEP_ID=MMETSP0019_2-20121128/15583_1 /TAXON_ID=98059 /ORGANISM="Dinobryon sp., Strain UTEXLB2267" /LENGTH=273 /DNA_ID=CAMNT_0010292423 /DNA_START=966 /DNA_END=1788 /DNA_ORIENTATION=+
MIAGRDPGINGRPQIFSASEKENVVNILHQERQEGINIDYEEGKRLCQKEWINSPERDLNSPMPDFSPKYFRGLLKENNFQMKIPTDRIVLKSDLQFFFENYKNAIDAHIIKTKYIWNCDETMLDGGKSMKKPMCEKSGLPTVALEQKLGEHITLLLFVSAEGEWLKPLAIFPLKTLPEFAPSVYEDFNPQGKKMDGLMGLYFETIFKTALLVMDHHSSRDGLDAEMLRKHHKILVLLIPAHSSHIVQPLDLMRMRALEEIGSCRSALESYLE